MWNRMMFVPLLLAGVYGSLCTLGLEQILLSARAGVALGAQPPTSVIQAQPFELVDAAGAVRGALRMAPEVALSA